MLTQINSPSSTGRMTLSRDRLPVEQKPIFHDKSTVQRKDLPKRILGSKWKIYVTPNVLSALLFTKLCGYQKVGPDLTISLSWGRVLYELEGNKRSWQVERNSRLMKGRWTPLRQYTMSRP